MAAMNYDDRSYTLEECHAKDYECHAMRNERFQHDLYAGTQGIFFDFGKAMIIVDTECLDTFGYYLIGFYWSGKNIVRKSFHYL